MQTYCPLVVKTEISCCILFIFLIFFLRFQIVVSIMTPFQRELFYRKKNWFCQWYELQEALTLTLYNDVSYPYQSCLIHFENMNEQ